MWRLHKQGVWNKEELQPIHYVLPTYNLESDEEEPAWTLIIQDRNRNQLYYWNFDFTTTMCWHNYYWDGWTQPYDFATN